MKKISTIILSLLFAAVFTLPVFAEAATSPGVKPGNLFYFFDTSFEKIGLFFTFSPEKKARRAMQYADERLAEIEVIAEEKDTDAVKTAINNYENNVALAAEKSKEVTDKAKAESLLVSIEDKTEKNQEVLSVVLTKVPEEAREAILRAISASRKGQEEAAKQIAELKGEVEKLKQEVEELKAKDEEREKMIEELSKQKLESAPVKLITPQTADIMLTPKAPVAPQIQTSIIVTPVLQTQPTTAVGEKLDYTKTKYVVAFYSKKVGEKIFVCKIDGDSMQLITKMYAKWDGCYFGSGAFPQITADQQDKVSFTIQVQNIDREGIGHKKVSVTSSSGEVSKELETDEYGIAGFDFSTWIPGDGYITLRTDDGFARDIRFYATNK